MIDAFQKEGLSIKETCAVSGLGKTTIYEAISAGQLEARKCGKRTIILPDALRRFLTSLPTVQPEALRSSSMCEIDAPLAEPLLATVSRPRRGRHSNAGDGSRHSRRTPTLDMGQGEDT